MKTEKALNTEKELQEEFSRGVKHGMKLIRLAIAHDEKKKTDLKS